MMSLNCHFLKTRNVSIYQIIFFFGILCPILNSQAIQEAPLINVNPTHYTDRNITNETVFTFDAKSSYCKVFIRCISQYPTEWFYQYPKSDAQLYEDNHPQFIFSTRNYNESNIWNAILYQTKIALSCHTFIRKKQRLVCRSISDSTIWSGIETDYVTDSATLPLNNTIMDGNPYKNHYNIINLTFRVLMNESDFESNASTNETEPSSSNCSIIFYVRERSDGREPPEWKCSDANGTVGRVEFAYCRTGMACANLFRTSAEGLRKSCLKNFGETHTCVGCVSPRSFEPGMAYCSFGSSTNKKPEGAQQFFYSFLTATKVSEEVNSIEDFNDIANTVPDRFKLQFSWDNVTPKDMIWLRPNPDTLYKGEPLNVTCYLSEFYFVDYRVGIKSKNGTFVHNLYGNWSFDTTYNKQSNSIVLKALIPGDSITSMFEFDHAQCWGLLWNSTEWVNVNTTSTGKITFANTIPPYFSEVYQKIELFIGDPIYLSCQNETARPEPNYSWTFNNRLILPNSYGSSSRYDGLYNFGQSMYSFSTAKSGHEGTYKCTAGNIGGNATKKFEVLLDTNPMPNFRMSIENVTLYVGEIQKSLNCTASGRKPFSRIWFKNSEITQNISETWTFEKVEMGDAGSYNCRIANFDGQSTKIFNVVVKEPVKPRFTLTNETFVIYAGLLTLTNNSASNACIIAAGDPEPVTQFYAEENPEIAIYFFTKSGNYICTAQNRFGNATKIVLVVENHPIGPRFDSAVETIFIPWGSRNKSILCEVDDGDPEPEVQWTRKESLVTNKYENSPWLFDIVTNEDEGKYTCLVSNEVGTAKKLFVVIVTGSSDPSTTASLSISNVSTWISLVILLIALGVATLTIRKKLDTIGVVLRSWKESPVFPSYRQGDWNGDAALTSTNSMIELYQQ